MGNSCNTTFAALANEVGAEKMQETAEGFGFNQPLPRRPRARRPSRSSPRTWTRRETGQSGIGQFEVAATPLQMAMVAAGIANGGIVMKPYLVDEIRSPELDVLDKAEPEEFRRAVSASTAGEVTELMTYTVYQGTASPAAIPGVEVAGKTGTAQSGIPDVPPYAWFVSFAPADDPQVAVAIMIQKADIPRGEIAGGLLAGPIAKSVMEAVIQMSDRRRRLRGRRPSLHASTRGSRPVAWARCGAAPTPSWAARSRSSCSRPSTPTTRRSAPGSRPRPGTPRRSTTPTSQRSTTSARPPRPTAPACTGPTS